MLGRSGAFFRKQGNVDTMLGEVTEVDWEKKEVVLGSTRVGYDYLDLGDGGHAWVVWTSGVGGACDWFEGVERGDFDSGTRF